MRKKVTHEEKVVLLSSLTEFPGNPNIHPVDQVKAIAESMEKYGQYYNIIVDESLQILCGHGKKLALEHLGKKEGKVTIMSGLDKKQKMKLVLEDNKIQSMSYVNFGKIEAIIKDIGDTDIIGFGTDYINAIINEVNIKDNMGVNFSEPAKQQQQYTEEKEEEEIEEYNNIEQGMQMAQTMTCPHCGGEITI